MKWKISFYNKSVSQNIEQWPAGIYAKFIRIGDLLEEHGPFTVGMPKVKNLGSGLFEIRVMAKEGIGRALFCITHSKEIIILHAFIKKTQKIPIKDLEISKTRQRSVKTLWPSDLHLPHSKLKH